MLGSEHGAKRLNPGPFPLMGNNDMRVSLRMWGYSILQLYLLASEMGLLSMVVYLCMYACAL